MINEDYENYIAIINISDFCELGYASLNNTKSNDIFNISSQDDIDKLNTDFSKYELIIITADLDDKNSYNLISKFLELVKNNLILGFFKNYNNKFDFNNRFNNIVDLSGLIFYELFYILKLIPDMLTIPTLVGIDFEDFKKVLNISKIFKPKVIEFSNNQINDDLFNKVNLSKSNSYLFCIYGNSETTMNDVTSVCKGLMDKEKDNSLCVYNYIINPRNKNNYLVILCGENE